MGGLREEHILAGIGIVIHESFIKRENIFGDKEFFKKKQTFAGWGFFAGESPREKKGDENK
jgi:hypothetical protein